MSLRVSATKWTYFLKIYHHLKSIHVLHLQVELEQFLTIITAARQSHKGIARRAVGITDMALHFAMQKHIVFRIVNDQNARIKNFLFADHQRLTVFCPLISCQSISARSSMRP